MEVEYTGKDFMVSDLVRGLTFYEMTEEELVALVDKFEEEVEQSLQAGNEEMYKRFEKDPNGWRTKGRLEVWKALGGEEHDFYSLDIRTATERFDEMIKANPELTKKYLDSLADIEEYR